MRADVYNGAALAAAICASAFGATGTPEPVQVRAERTVPRAALAAPGALHGSKSGLRDASGTVAPLAHYARIASTSLVADHVLWELCEPDRLIAVSQRTKQSAHFGHRHRSRAGIGAVTDLEPILALDPDLLFVNRFGDPRHAAQLRERGVVVFDLGEMRGMSTLAPNVRAIGALLGASERAEALLAAFERRMRSVAADVPASVRPGALYLSSYGNQLYGGGADTSYDDVLRHAGLHNLAAPHHRGWPAFGPEQVLSLDPDVIVTRRGMGATLCRFPGLSSLRPCRGLGRIAELEAELIDDPGLPMLDVTEALREQIHGRAPRR
jgi:iron complex transport system substrate-binding protein